MRWGWKMLTNYNFINFANFFHESHCISAKESETMRVSGMPSSDQYSEQNKLNVKLAEVITTES
jgi:hypothetical protein